MQQQGKYSAADIAPAPDVTPDAPQEQPQSMLSRVEDFGKGIGKGIVGTMSTADDWATRHMPTWMTTPIGQSATPENSARATAYAKQLATPNNTAQAIGKGVEQAGEFLIPGGAEEKGAAALSKFVPKALAKAGTAAVGAGLVNKAQGGSFKSGATAGAIGSGVGQFASKVAPILAESAMGVRGVGALMKGGSALRTAAIGDTDAAALRGLRVPPGSNKIQKMTDAVQTARPWLKGVRSLEELQQRIPLAKDEIWQPYRQAIEGAGHHSVLGPDGPTTIADLENERLQLSALNRGLKTGQPDALQLAQQKGMTQAQLLDRERAITSALDPALQNLGIDPLAIRQNFGAVSRIGGTVSGKSTLLEKPTPFGLSKIAKADIHKPLEIPSTLVSGIRDIAAGRPLFGGSATDIGIREGFRDAPLRPNLGSFRPAPSVASKLLPSSTIGEGGGADFTGGGYPGRQSIITPAPSIPKALPEFTAESATQPMVGIKAPFHPGVAEDFAKTRIRPTEFSAPEPLASRLFVAGDTPVQVPKALLSAPKGEVIAPKFRGANLMRSSGISRINRP